jgi:glycosyltransferase involved in cell wall biosynthesis
MDKISIITVCYNAEDTICKTMDSVINQTYPFVEYIIIDGNSTDSTCKLIKDYEQLIINRGYEFVFYTENDKGIYDAMNKGILLSTGKWVHFRNSGDYFFDNKVIENIFTQEINSTTEIIHGDIRVWDKYGYCDKKPSILSRTYKVSMPVWHPSAFIKTELHKKLLYDISYHLSGDYDFFFKCFRSIVPFQYFPILVALVNVEEGASITNRMLGLKENLKLKGLDGSIFNLGSLKIIDYYCQVKKLLKMLLPSKYIEKKQIKNRKENGWAIKV